ncbi:hypothetical protein KDI_00090 [Dictyobacter arantiisoli]|uniref:Uncharacterized protein n=1 Tax=Dictyobacter arantiisoli TaxID=2014874 RepID=A0A5A5T5H9_9CHLR|nr:hypothetical protein KDI_00090 [Dictyobacter arantiisoli]
MEMIGRVIQSYNGETFIIKAFLFSKPVHLGIKMQFTGLGNSIPVEEELPYEENGKVQDQEWK